MARNPDQFDPGRFDPGRAEHLRHEFAFVPQGAGDMQHSHVCAGIEYTTVLLSAFIIELLRGYEWSLPPQDLDFVWAKIPAEPRSGLMVDFRKRAPR